MKKLLFIFYCSNTEIYLQFCNIRLPAHLYAARIWRWHDLSINSQLKSINTCNHRLGTSTNEDMCINPYHYERFDRSGIKYILD